MTPWSADGKSTKTQQGQADEPKEDAGDNDTQSQGKTLDLDNEVKVQEASSKASTKTGGDGVSTCFGQYAGGIDYIPNTAGDSVSTFCGQYEGGSDYIPRK